jgi:hypothetical protein
MGDTEDFFKVEFLIRLRDEDQIMVTDIRQTKQV